MRKRGESLERSFAHCYQTGGMQRTHLRGRGNILKRLLIHVWGFNLRLAMRSLSGVGKPRQTQDGLAAALLGLFVRILALPGSLCRSWGPSHRPRSTPRLGTCFLSAA